MTGPLLVYTGTGNPVPDEPIAVVFFFLGAMAMKNSKVNCKTRFSQLRTPYLARQRCRWETTPMGSQESLLRLRGAGL